MTDMTVIVLLLVVWIAGCLLLAGLLWALAAAQTFGHAGRELAHWLRDPRTPRWIRVGVAMLVLGPIGYVLIGIAQLAGDLLVLVAK